MAEYEENSQEDTKAIWKAKYDTVSWKPIERPGYFGKARDKKIAALNKKYGVGNWDLRWVVFDNYQNGPPTTRPFVDACSWYYEQSYLLWFHDHPDELDIVCSYGECIDNAMTNIRSGCDYSKQEASSTHIQDIALRNVLRVNGRVFEGPKDKILVIRSADSTGFKYGPGNIPFHTPSWITQPSLCPKWAQKGSVEDFWQSNKWICVKE